MAEATATGKAALSVLEEHTVEAIIKRAGLPRYTSNTHTDLRKLKAELAAIRARGYSINWEENTVGVGSVAAAIPGAKDGFVPVLSIGFATSQIERKEIPALGVRVAKAAGAIGKRFS